MKKYTLMMSLVCLVIFATSCGKNSTQVQNPVSSSQSVASSPVVATDKLETNVNPAYVGVWGGYSENIYTIITIKADGNVTVKYFGEQPQGRSIYIKDNRYYIVNNETKTGVPLKVNGNLLTVTLKKTEVNFTKDE